ncbi:Lar family restriction alleviation protein [Variovorax sp. N23]|uniref:Lar family restriction alleviation protein n=1 Tax=Variovorax sp. N23 TaxID=2980555 RepID=UPI0021C8164D|nr:Lar family restriction alleviation protein [Variovorax sp. N23]MCU4119359.1 Lar family restriction alleviation protein [Variovorax sp. N23]
MSAELKPCPFCSHQAAPKIIDRRDLQDLIDGEFDESNDVYFAVICDASRPGGPGGCGGMGGFAATKEKAVDLWNQRATPAPGAPGKEAAAVQAVGAAPEAGHVMTLRDHHCGEFKDDFDWGALPPHYLQHIGHPATTEGRKP